MSRAVRWPGAAGAEPAPESRGEAARAQQPHARTQFEYRLGYRVEIRVRFRVAHRMQTARDQLAQPPGQRTAYHIEGHRRGRHVTERGGDGPGRGP